MKFYELFKRYTDEDIIKQVIKLYPDQKKSKKGYQSALKELRKLKPKRTEFSIRVTKVRDGKDRYEHVDGYRHGEGYGIEFTSWPEWLGMYIDMQSLYRIGHLDFLCHSLWEMTWSGFSNKEVQGEWKELKGRADECLKSLKVKVKEEKKK